MLRQRVRTAKSSSRSSKSSPSSQGGRSASAPSPRQQVSIGTIVRVHGVRGAVIVRADPSVRDVLGVGLHVEIETGQTVRATTIASVAPHGAGLLVRLRDLDDRTSAESLVGASIRVDRAALPTPGADEYYDFEIIGCEVITNASELLGTVSEIIVTGANDVYVVTSDDDEVLIPATAGAVLEIDRDRRRIVVEPSALEYSGSTRSRP